MIGRIVSHFRVLEKPSAVGMDVVHRTRDGGLRRFVAQKALLEEPGTGDRRFERLRREAQATSS